MSKKLYSRTEAMQILGVSRNQMVRIEKANSLTPIKLVKTKNGSVYYKVEEIDKLINGELG